MHQNPFADRLQSGRAGGDYAFPPDLAAIGPTSKEREGEEPTSKGDGPTEWRTEGTEREGEGRSQGE